MHNDVCNANIDSTGFVFVISNAGGAYSFKSGSYDSALCFNLSDLLSFTIITRDCFYNLIMILSRTY